MREILRRVKPLFSYYMVLVALFIAEKPLFMLYQSLVGVNNGYLLRDVMEVVWHGLPIDLSVAGYLTIIPLLAFIADTWIGRDVLKKLLYIYIAIVSLLLALIFIGDVIVYPYWGTKLDSSVFFYLRSPKDAIASVSVWTVIIGVFVVLLFGSLISLALCRAVRNVEPLTETSGKLIITLICILLMFPLFVLIRGGLSQSTMNVGRAYFSSDQYLNHAAVNPAFNLLSTMEKSEDYNSMFQFFDETELNGILPVLLPADGLLTDTLLNTDRPDILLVILEGFGADMIESLDGEPDVAPNMERMKDEGLFFTNCYAGSFRTDRGTVCILNGHQGLPTVSIMKMPEKSSTLPSIPGKLKNAGYSTSFLYGGDINFTNMQSYLWSNGYEMVESDKDFTMAQRATGAWGVTDSILFDRLYEELVSIESRPWHKAVLTLSSHEPFEVPYDRMDDKILNSFAYTDHCLGNFVDRLRKTHVWDNLLMIVVPDHGFCYRPTNRHYPHAHHIPMIWMGGALRDKGVTEERLMSQSDIAATLLAQLGMDTSEFLFSRNVYSDNYTYPSTFYSFINGFAFADSTGTTLYDNDSDDVFYNEGTEDCSDRVAKGRAILQYLYKDLGSR